MRQFLRSAVAACALMLAGVGLSAQQPVLDPLLRSLLDPARSLEAPDAFGGSAAAAALAARIAIDTDAAGRERVGLLVQMRSTAALDMLRALGAEIGAVAGDVATVRLPLTAIDALPDLPLDRVQVARVLRLEHDSSMMAIGADAVRRRESDGWSGATGAGVLVGVIDTGIDLLHPDFHDDDGVSRVVALWDQTVSGRRPEGFGYGRYCTAADVHAVVESGTYVACPSVDSHGHGTHVAGTAAGDGSAGATPYRYAGVAPEAELLVVKTGDGTVTEDRVVDALLWLREESRARGLPLVVNMSFGHDFSPHDGSTLLEKVIDDLAAPGFIMVVSAGNTGANDNAGDGRPELIHARVRPLPHAADTAMIEVGAYRRTTNGCGNFIWLSAWQHPDERLTITVVRPNGTSVVAQPGAIAIGEDQEGRIAITNAFGPQTEDAAEIFIELDGCGPSLPPAPGVWKMVFQAGAQVTSAPVDVYMHTQVLGSEGKAWGAAGFDNRRVVSSPGAARRAVTVGAFATRGCWPNGGSENCFDNREEVGDIARFSAAGPTRDERVKPEIAAPGIAIVSSLSRTAIVPAERVTPDGTHWALEGTSMAAPHVAGTIALLMQNRPFLSTQDVLSMLPRTARQDAFTSRTYDDGGAPRDWWGYGKLYVPAILGLLQGGGTVTAVSVSPESDTLPRGGTTTLLAHTLDASGEIIFGPLVWSSLDAAAATVDGQGSVTAVALGEARIVARSGPYADTAHVTVVEPGVLIVTRLGDVDGPPANVRAGMLLPLSAWRLTTDGPEGVRVREIAFEVSGHDPAARLLLLDDANSNGSVDDGEHTVLRTGAVELGPVAREVVLSLDSLTLPANISRDLLLAVEVSRSPPHGTTFEARLLPDGVRTVNLVSRAEDRVAIGDGPARAIARTTVLLPGESFAMSENPVRGDQVIFSFGSMPSYAGVFTAAGTRVADLSSRIASDRFVWDLTNDDGRRIVPGVYLVVFRVGNELVREKLFVLSPQSAGGSR